MPQSPAAESALDEFLRDRTVLSPLRYPGGKRRLVPYLAAAMATNDLKPELLVEPYAGGAAVALELLHADRVERIALGDADPMVAAFWQTVFEDSEWLIKHVRQVPLDLETWTRIKRGNYTTRRNLALACLYLNRTSFNGALHRRAGPIGGKAGQSDYDIGCRFPRERLVNRIKACAALADRVEFVADTDALKTIKRARELAADRGWTTFFYLDPPFWAKSALLYRPSFGELEHERLAEGLWFMREPFVLSYDPAPEIEEHYEGRRNTRVEQIELLYSANPSRSGARELIISNLAELPATTRLWRSATDEVPGDAEAAAGR